MSSLSSETSSIADYENRIICGDAGSVLRSAPFLGIDCVVTSPPYFGLRNYTGNEKEIGQEETLDLYLDTLVDLFKIAATKMNRTGSIWVNLGDNIDKAVPQLVPWRFMFKMVKSGFILRNVVIWYKPDAMSESTERRFTQKYEPFFWFTISNNYYFNFEAATIPCKVSTVSRLEHKFYANKGTDVSRMAGLIGDMSHKVDEYLERGVNAGDTWLINTNKEKTEHIAPFPVELVVRPIVATCPPGGLVFDPFMGSGTVAFATAQVGNGRRYLGTDIDPGACEYAQERASGEAMQGKLF